MGFIPAFLLSIGIVAGNIWIKGLIYNIDWKSDVNFGKDAFKK